MSKIGKKGRRALIALTVVALMAGCFVAVGLYAKNEINKPKFENNEPLVSSVTKLPKSKSDVLAYLHRLYDDAVNADDVEVSWHTDVKKSDYADPMVTPFSESDNKVIEYVLKQAGGNLFSDLYPREDGVLKSADKGVFAFDLDDADVLSVTAEQGEGNNDGFYFFTLEVSPDVIDDAAITAGEVFAKYKDAVSGAFAVEDASVETQGVRMSFRVERQYDELASVEITRSYRVKASVRPQNDFTVMTSGGDAPVTVEFPYEATEKISFYYYGAYFTQNWFAIKPGDWQAIPARVHVHADEAQENFKITYTSSDPDVLTVDEDGVMRVETKGVSDETVTVSMTLEYDGHVYSDDITVYITTKEVKTGE